MKSPFFTSTKRLTRMSTEMFPPRINLLSLPERLRDATKLPAPEGETTTPVEDKTTHRKRRYEVLHN